MKKTIESYAFGEKTNIPELLVVLGACSSHSEAKRLVDAGAVEIDRVKVGREATIFNKSVLQCGKHFWRRLMLDPKKLTFDINEDKTEATILNIE